MIKEHRRQVFFGSLLFLAVAVSTGSGADSGTDWTLNDRCPAGFAPDADGHCRLVSLYREYPSLQDRGMGGLKIGLSTIRDGFTPRQIDLGRLLFFDPLLSGNGQALRAQPVERRAAGTLFMGRGC